MQIKEQIRNFVIENYHFNSNNGVLEDHQSLLDTGIIDSTGVLELVSFIEETFNIRVENDELLPENLDSIKNLIKFIELKKTEGKLAA